MSDTNVTEVKKVRCGAKCQIYALCTGYFAPISNWNRGKREEFKDRKPYDYNVR